MEKYTFKVKCLAMVLHWLLKVKKDISWKTKMMRPAMDRQFCVTNMDKMNDFKFESSILLLKFQRKTSFCWYNEASLPFYLMLAVNKRGLQETF